MDCKDMRNANFVVGIHRQIDKPESPFISMQMLHRSLIIAVAAIYLIFIGVQGRFSSTPTSVTGWVLLALTVNMSLLLVPVVFYKPSYGWFHPLVFGIFTAIIDHLRKTSTYINGLQWHDALLGWNSESLTVLVAYDLALSTLSLVAYYIGFFFSPTLGVPRVTFSQPRHLSRKVLLAVIFSAVVFAAYMQTRGGIVAHLVSWGRGRSIELAGQFYWDFFIQFGVVACLIWLAIDRKAHLQVIFWGCAGTLLLIAFLTSGSRSIVIYYIILGLLVWQLRERKIAGVKLMIAVFISLVILSVLGEFRNSTSKFERGIDWDIMTQFFQTESIFGSATGELQERSGAGNGTFPILALVPDEVGFLYGSSYLAVLTLPIPRVLWPEKPGLVGGLVGDTFFAGSSFGVPPGPTGEAYWNFGIAGVLVVFFLFGVFHKWLAMAFRKYAGEPVALVPYVLTLYLFKPSGPGLHHWLYSLIPTIIILYAVGAISFRRRVKKT